MKSAIICFSQTGNTLKVAEKIREGILENIEHCDLLKMEETDFGLLTDYDLIGLGCPVFYYKEPFNVRDFMGRLPPQNSKPWFIFCSHGAVLGTTLISMTDCLEKKGALVVGSHHTYADITVPYYPKHFFSSGHPDDQDLREAFDFGKSIIKISKAVSNNDISLIKKPSPVDDDWSQNDADMLTREFLSKVIPPFSINLETCTQCGQCEDLCPVNGIDINSDPPRLQEPCIYCLHCINMCPTCSIEADWSQWYKMAPANFERYKKILNSAKERGEFRWLIDPESVDADNPLYEQRKREVEGV